MLGSADYLAPEQARGEEVDARADLYSVGVLTFRMLTGQLPFPASDTLAALQKHAFEEPPDVCDLAPDTPRGLALIVAKLLRKSPAERYQSAAEVLAAIEMIDSAQQIVVAPSFGHAPFLPFKQGREWAMRLRLSLKATFQLRAPKFLKDLQSTQQQLDGAISEYRWRRDKLADLKYEAEAVEAELRTQLIEYQNVASTSQQHAETSDDDETAKDYLREKLDANRQAEELQIQLDQQSAAIDEIDQRLTKAESTLHQLTTQQSILEARLKTAEAQARVAGGRVARQFRIQPLVTLLILAAVCLLAFWPSRDSIVNGPIDLLTGIEPDRDFIVGDWKFDGPTLISPAERNCRIQVPLGFTPDEYVLRIRAKRTTGQDVLAVGLLHNKSRFRVLLDADGGVYRAIGMVDGQSAYTNTTRRWGRCLETGVEHTIEFQVQSKNVSILVDGKQVFDWTGDYSDLSIPRWWEVDDQRAFIIGTSESTRYEFSEVVLDKSPASRAAPFQSSLPNREYGPTIEDGVVIYPILNQIQCISFVREGDPSYGKGFLTGHQDGTIGFYRIAGPAKVSRNLKPVHTDSVRQLAFSRNHETFAAAAEDGKITVGQLWGDLNPMTVDTKLQSIDALYYSGDDNSLLVMTDGDLSVWSLSSLRRASSQGNPAAEGLLLQAMPDEVLQTNRHRKLITINAASKLAYFIEESTLFIEESTLKVYDINAGQWHQDFSPAIIASVSDDGSRIWIADSQHKLHLLDARGARISTYSGHRDRIEHVAISPRGEYGVSASRDGSIRICNLSQQ